LALVLPFVAMLALLLVQVGIVVHDRILVTHAAREAARAGAVTTDADAPRRAAEAGGGLDPRRLRVTADRKTSSPASVHVEIHYEAATDVPLVGPLLPDVPLSASATMRDET
jgi:hypothetical protein